MQAIVSVWHWFWGFLAFLLGTLMILLLLPFEKLRFRSAAWLSWMVLWALGARLKIEGKYPRDRCFIFMLNHSTFVDTFIATAVLDGLRFTAVMAEEQMHYPIWGALLRRFKVIAIRRREPNAARAAIALAEDRIKSGINVGIMPEGTRTVTGKIGPLKKGGFHMAVNTGAPILVIGIEGGFKFKRKTSWHINPGPITARIGQPIEAATYSQLSMEAVMEEVRQQLLVLSGEMEPGEEEDVDLI